MVQKNNMKNHVTIAYTPNEWIHMKDQTGPLVSINDLTTLGSCRPEHFLGRMQSICEVEPLELWVMWVLGETPAMGVVSLKMMSLELCFRRNILRDARWWWWCIIRWHEHHEDHEHHEHPMYPLLSAFFGLSPLAAFARWCIISVVTRVDVLVRCGGQRRGNTRHNGIHNGQRLGVLLPIG